MLHNKIVGDADTATRLFETLEHDQTGVQTGYNHNRTDHLKVFLNPL